MKQAGTQKLTYTKAKQKLLAVAIFATLAWVGMVYNRSVTDKHMLYSYIHELLEIALCKHVFYGHV